MRISNYPRLQPNVLSDRISVVYRISEFRPSSDDYFLKPFSRPQVLFLWFFFTNFTSTHMFCFMIFTPAFCGNNCTANNKTRMNWNLKPITESRYTTHCENNKYFNLKKNMPKKCSCSFLLYTTKFFIDILRFI